MNSIGSGIGFDVKFINHKSRNRPLAPDDLAIVGNLSNARNVYIHTGMGGFGNVAVGTAKVLADIVAEDIAGHESITRAKYNFLSPTRFAL